MKPRHILKITLCVLLIIFATSSVWAQLTEHQANRIKDAAPEEARVSPEQPRRVLIWNTPFMENSPHKGYSIPQSEFAFKILGEKTGAYKPVVSDDQTMFLKKNLKQFDAIILNNANGKWIRPTDETLKRLDIDLSKKDEIEQQFRKNFLEFFKNGGGLFAFHHAIGGNTHWPEFLELIGAGYWGHPWNEEVGIKVEEPDHPLLNVFGGKDFRIADEIFQFKEPYSRDKVRVLLSLDTQNTNMDVPWIHRKDGDFALAWVHPYGEGRVFYSAIGHRTVIWWNKKILRFYLDAMQFVLGDIDAPIKPRTPKE